MGLRRRRHQQQVWPYSAQEEEEQEEEEGQALDQVSLPRSNECMLPLSSFGSMPVSSAPESSAKPAVGSEYSKSVMDVLHRLQSEIGGLRSVSRADQRALKQSMAEVASLAARVESLTEDRDELEAILDGQSKTGLGRSHKLDSLGPQRDLEDEDRRRRAAAKSALIAGVNLEDDEDDIFAVVQGTNSGKMTRALRQIKRWFSRGRPLARDVAMIQARYGSSVASYFVFYRWLITTYLFAAVAVGIWMLVHLLYISSLSAGLVGLVPAPLAYSSFSPREKNAYVLMVTAITALLVGVALNKWLREDRLRQRLLLLDEEQKHVQFAKTVLLAWDNSLNHEREIEDLRCSHGMQIVVMMQEDSLVKGNADRTRRERLQLAMRRVAGMLIYIGLQLAAWYAIVLLTSRSQTLGEELQQEVEDWGNSQLSSFAQTFSTSIVPAAVTVINAVMPVAIKKITTFERWDREKTVTYMLTTRMYLAKILNAFIQAVSFLLLADPYLLAGARHSDVRRNIEQSFNAAAFSCRIDQASSGLFQLVITEFVASKVINFAMPNIARLISHLRGKTWVRGEFEVAKFLVSLLYFEALALACFPFFPASIIFIVIFMVVSFKSDVLLLMRYNTKPQKPWAANDAGSFFVKLLLGTHVFGIAVYLTFLVSSTFPKDCPLQDQTPQLCTADTSGETPCTMNPSSAYFQWFSSPEASGCSSYPGCVCSENFSCGPFTGDTSAWMVLDGMLRNIAIVGSVLGLIIDHSLFAWVLALIAHMGSLFNRNVLTVAATAFEERHRTWMAERSAMGARLRKQMKQISKLQVQAGLGNSKS